MQKPALTNAPLHDLMMQRWSPCSFDGNSLTAQQLQTLLEAARWAPSCFNEQPWRYLAATSSDDGFATLCDVLVEANQAWAKNAGALLLACVKENFSHNDKENVCARHDVGLANAHLVLQAQAMGLIAHQMAGFDVDKARTAFAIPEGYTPVVMLAVGIPAETLSSEFAERDNAPRVRNALSEMAFSGRFGEALKVD